MSAEAQQLGGRVYFPFTFFSCSHENADSLVVMLKHSDSFSAGAKHISGMFKFLRLLGLS